MLVATDAAARGIDIPAIEHVVQADFAADFLHRVGPLCLPLGVAVAALFQAIHG